MMPWMRGVRQQQAMGDLVVVQLIQVLRGLAQPLKILSRRTFDYVLGVDHQRCILAHYFIQY